MLQRVQKNSVAHTYIYALRCCAMYLVIALHCVSGHISNLELFGTRTWWMCDIVDALARMGVPTFFMISGFLMLSSENTLHIGEFYRKRLQKILPPFLVWDVIYFLHSLVQGRRTVGGGYGRCTAVLL